MLATYRCNEIKEQSLLLFENEFKILNKSTNNGIMYNFKQYCEELMGRVLAAYDETAKNYFQRIYKEVRENLISYIINQFYVGFTNQGRLFIPLSQKNLIKDIEKELMIKDNFSEVVGKLKAQHIEHFLKFIRGIQLSDQWDLNLNSVIEIFDDVIANYRKIKLEEKKKDHIVILFF